MGVIADQAAEVYREFATDGVPASGYHRPAKAEIRALFEDIEAYSALQFSDASVIPTVNLDGSGSILLLGQRFVLDAGDTASVHDGVNVLVSLDGLRFKRARIAAIGPYVTHTFPEDNAATGVTRVKNAAGQAFAIFCYGGKTSQSIEAYREIIPGVYSAAPVATVSVDFPEGISSVLHNGVMWVASGAYRGGVGDAVYDRSGYIWEFTGTAFTQRDTWPSFGQKRCEFHLHSNGTLRLLAANSVSSTRNTSGQAHFENCSEQSCMIRKLTGSTWGIDQEFNVSGALYQPIWFEYENKDYMALFRYYDTGTTLAAAGVSDLRYRAETLVIEKVANSWSLSNVRWRIASKGASSGVVIQKDARLFIRYGNQRDDGAFGGNDKYQFQTLSATVELKPNGVVEPVQGSAIAQFNCYMVRKLDADSSTFTFDCNGSSGGTYPTNFNEGSCHVHRFDERAMVPVSHMRLGGKGCFDAFPYVEDGMCFVLLAEGQRGENNSYSSTLPSRCYCIGSLDVGGSELDPAWYELPSPQRNRIVNPVMRVSQENGQNTGTTSGYSPADRWRLRFANTAAALEVGNTNMVTPAGANQAIILTATTGGSVSANGYVLLEYAFEGQEIADFEWNTTLARAAWLRFAFRGPAGTYGVQIVNNALANGWTSVFTIGAGEANTMTQQRFWIPPALRSGGTWPGGAEHAGYLRITLAAGADWQAAAPGWQAANKFGTTAITNNVATASASFRLADVGLYRDPLENTMCPAFEVPSVADDLAACQRHYQRHRVRLLSSVTNGTAPIMLPVTMRVPAAGTLPSLTVTPDSGTGAEFVALGTAALGSGAAYQSVAHSASVSATLTLDARL